MTIKQRQCLLAYLGYYAGPIDGIWGEKSLDATICFQDDFGGIRVDGICGEETDKALRHAVAYGMPTQEAEEEPEKGDFWDDIEFFTREEFRCQCGGKYCDGFPVEPDKELVLALDEFRRRLGVPVRIVEAGGSGIRCPRHNASIKGAASDSQHLYGKAADLHSSKSPKEMYAVAEAVLGDTGGIGLYSWGIHFDTRPEKARWKG